MRMISEMLESRDKIDSLYIGVPGPAAALVLRSCEEEAAEAAGNHQAVLSASAPHSSASRASVTAAVSKPFKFTASSVYPSFISIP